MDNSEYTENGKIREILELMKIQISSDYKSWDITKNCMFCKLEIITMFECLLNLEKR